MLTQLNSFFIYCSILIIPGGFIFVGYYITRLNKIKDPEEKKKAANKLLKPFMVLFLIIWFGSAISLKLTSNQRMTEFQNLSKSSLMHLQRGSRSVNVDDSRQISDFFSIFARSHSVGAHHSHPLNQVTFSFANSDKVYSLGKDSSNADEFWFTLERGNDLGFGEIGKHLAQFQSAEMTAWLKKAGFDPNQPD